MEDQNSAYALSNIDARSPAMQLLLGQVRDVAQNAKATVLLQGETGERERISGARHPLQRTSGHRTVCRRGNCTAIPKELFESRLFGYEREPSPAPINENAACSKGWRAARSFWMKSAI